MGKKCIVIQYSLAWLFFIQEDAEDILKPSGISIHRDYGFSSWESVTSVYKYVIKSTKGNRFWVKVLGAYGLYKFLYFCLLDPLRHIPGPWWARFTSIPYQFPRFRGEHDRTTAVLHKKYGSVVRVGPNLLTVGKCKDVKQILATYKYPKSKVYANSITKEQDLFATLSEEFNRTRRRQIGSAFTQTGLDSVEDLVLNVGIIALKQKLDQEIERGNGQYIFNFFTTFQSLTADVIGELSFGKTFNAVKNGGHPILDWANNSIRVNAYIAIFPLIDYMPFALRNLKKDKVRLIDFTLQSIKSRRDLIESNIYKVDRTDILQMLVTAVNPNGAKLTDSEVIAETVLMLLAGTDTTSVTMTWLLHFYTLYPKVYRRVLEEINDTFPNKTQLIKYKEAQQNLTYFMATVYECMRLKPAVSGVLPRDSSSEGVKLSEYYIPPDVEMLLFVEGANCDPSVWESPRKFIPERFLGENGKNLSKELVSFSSGVRICPGRNLAWMEILTVMPNLIRDYDIKLLPDSIYGPNILDTNRENEPLLFKDYAVGTRSALDYETVCRAIVSHKS